MKQKVRILNWDAQDSVGKTTNLNLFKKDLMKRGRLLHSTRLLGGDGECSFQLAMRQALLHPKFPKNSIELEEMMFGLTDSKGIEVMENFLEANPKGVALKDRNLFSHIAYSVAKGLSLNKTLDLHQELVRKEKELNQKYGSVNILLRPDSNDWVKKRLINRASTQGVDIVDRLENDTTQALVREMVDYLPNHTSMQGINFEVVTIKESDSIQAVHDKVTLVLEKYEI
jgi:thymidylate kinase